MLTKEDRRKLKQHQVAGKAVEALKKKKLKATDKKNALNEKLLNASTAVETIEKNIKDIEDFIRDGPGKSRSFLKGKVQQARQRASPRRRRQSPHS